VYVKFGVRGCFNATAAPFVIYVHHQPPTAGSC
jgi:hypothetical protein